ncbi:hypothetical protein ACE193_13770 [Bernardetia sp. OM2101]|uniref:hypothetical protein n=1 Tax=Bernardetia sp. OM2101 TaxID=3344876 RepID=UPI0035D12230
MLNNFLPKCSFNSAFSLNLLYILGSYVFYFDLIEKLFQKASTKWWLIFAFVSATPIYLIHHFVWSEAPFLLFLIGCIWAFYHKKHLLFYLFGLLFCAMRNAGLYFVIGINSGIVLFYVIPYLFENEEKK